MKMKQMLWAMISALVIMATASTGYGQIVVGGEDFEAYDLGAWTAITAPDANPETWYNGENANAIAAYILSTNSSQQLELDINLQDSWQVGITYNIACSNNESIYIKDYSMDLYLQIPPDSLATLTNASSLILNVQDPNDGSVGSAYNIANYDPGYSNALSGGVITVPLGSGGLASGSSFPMNGSLASWEIEFRVDSNHATNSQPILIYVDDMVVTYTEPPFLNTVWAPKGLTTNDPVVSATVHDGTKEVDSLLLYLDSGLVASNSVAGGSTSNTISYSFIGAAAGVHTGKVVAVAADAYAETNSWTFQVPQEAPAPATNIVKLYSFNFSGYANPDPVNELPYLNAIYQQSVSNGVLGAAPSLGSNVWNNLLFVNAWYIFNPWNHELVDSTGDTNSTCWFRLSDTNAVGAYLNNPWSWYYELNNFIANTATDHSMWPVWVGDVTTSIDLIIDGLYPTEKYDLYMYFTSNREIVTNTTTYTLVQGSAPLPVATLHSSWDPLKASLGGSPTNYVEGTNYCVITSVSPTSSGRVIVNVSGSGYAGGICAMQIAMRGDGEPAGPTINPNIHAITMAGGMVNLEWDSESNVVYSVLSKSDLTETNWTAVTNGIPGAGSTTSASVPAAAAQGFYQVMGE